MCAILVFIILVFDHSGSIFEGQQVSPRTEMIEGLSLHLLKLVLKIIIDTFCLSKSYILLRVRIYRNNVKKMVGRVTIFHCYMTNFGSESEDQSNEKSKGYLFRIVIKSLQGLSHHHLCSGEDSKASRGLGKLYCGEKGMALGMPSLEALGMEAIGRLTRIRTFFCD